MTQDVEIGQKVWVVLLKCMGVVDQVYVFTDKDHAEQAWADATEVSWDDYLDELLHGADANELLGEWDESYIYEALLDYGGENP